MGKYIWLVSSLGLEKEWTRAIEVALLNPIIVISMIFYNAPIRKQVEIR